MRGPIHASHRPARRSSHDIHPELAYGAEGRDDRPGRESKRTGQCGPTRSSVASAASAFSTSKIVATTTTMTTTRATTMRVPKKRQERSKVALRGKDSNIPNPTLAVGSRPYCGTIAGTVASPTTHHFQNKSSFGVAQVEHLTVEILNLLRKWTTRPPRHWGRFQCRKH